MQPKRFTETAIRLAWLAYKKKVMFRAQVAGQWVTFPTMDDARKANPLRVEVKLAKDCMEFPVFLAESVNDGAS